MSWFTSLFKNAPRKLRTTDGIICRFKAVAVAGSYQAQTWRQCKIASGWAGKALHAQACAVTDGKVTPLEVYHRDGSIGPGDWEMDFKPDTFTDLQEFVRTIFYLNPI